MIPHPNCEFVMSGKVQAGDYVCYATCGWYTTAGAIGYDIVDGVISCYTPAIVGGVRVCRPIKKKK